jgi:hypothetical protein
MGPILEAHPSPWLLVEYVGLPVRQSPHNGRLFPSDESLVIACMHLSSRARLSVRANVASQPGLSYIQAYVHLLRMDNCFSAQEEC